MIRENLDPVLSILTRWTQNVPYFHDWVVSNVFSALMRPKHPLLKSTNTQTFATQNYIALNSSSHQRIRRREIQCIVKHYNKKIQKYPFLAHNYVALNSSSNLRICKSKTCNLVKHPNKKLIFSPFLFFFQNFNNLKKENKSR